MDFNHQTVCADCDCGLGKRLHIGPDAGCMAGVYKNGKVAFGPNDRNGADVQRISGGRLIGADATACFLYIILTFEI